MVGDDEDVRAGLLPLYLVGINPEVAVVCQARQFGRNSEKCSSGS